MFKFRLPERLMSDYVPLFDHASPRVVMMKDGSAFAMFAVDGLPAQTLDDDVIFRARRSLNHSLCGMATTDGLVLYSWVCRGFADPSIYPAGGFRSSFARNLDQRYRAKLFDKFLFLNKTYVGVMLQAPKWLGRNAAEAPIERIRRLLRICDILEADLEPYKPRRLGLREDDKGRVFSEVAEALIFAMTGIQRSVGLQSNRRIGMLFSERVIAGRETIEIRTPGHSAWASCFGAKHMMWRCPPGALDGFLAANFRSTIAQSFRFMSMNEALTKMGRKQNRMVSAGDRAHSQIAELDKAQDEVQSSRMVLRDHSLVVTVFADDLSTMGATANDAWHVLQNSGAQVARENEALEAAYFSMLPGNAQYQPRPGAATSWNYASLAAMHAYPAGNDTGPWGPPLALFRTTGGTPFRYHLQSSTGVGGTFVYGESGSGKTVLLSFLVAQCERLGIQVVLWDKDRGLEIVTRAVGGRYLALGNPTDLAPLKALTASDTDIHFLAQLIRGMISIVSKYTMNPEEDRRLYVGLRAIMALPPKDRWLMDLRAFLGISAGGAGAHLERWCRGNEYGWVMDNAIDAVRLDAPVIGFDVTDFLEDKIIVGPIMSYLLHRTGKLVDGRRLLRIIDEGWKVIDIPEFSDDSKNHFKTDRKLNVVTMFGTQTISDALQSAIGATIREQCKTIIGFGVERPDRKDFKALRYSDRECEIIEQLKPGTGQFLLRQDGRSVVCQLPLAGLADDLAVLSGNEINVRILDAVRETHGDDDPDRLIEAFHQARKVAAR